MASTKKYSCVVCDAERKTTNHWFLAYAPSHPDESIVILAFTFEDADKEDALCICGRNCLNRWIDKNLSLLLGAVTASALSAQDSFQEEALPPIDSYDLITNQLALHGMCEHGVDAASCYYCNQLSIEDLQLYEEAARTAIYREDSK